MNTGATAREHPVSAIEWLLDSDPAIRWQAMRDLTDATSEVIAAERARVPREGIAERILACQGSNGSWHRPDAPDWLPTLFTMQLLRATGVDPADPGITSSIARLQSGFRWAEEFGAKPFFEGEVEPCINGGVLALGAYFGHPSEQLAGRLVSEQLGDGGWNCEAPKSLRSSFHTTICVLEGLLEYERAARFAPGHKSGSIPLALIRQVGLVRRRGEEYLLKRALFRRLSSGEVANPAFLKIAYPPRYHYDVLRALDYFRAADAHECSIPEADDRTSAETDARLSEALDVVESRRQSDGRWLLDDAHDEALALSLGESVGEPSRWNTLRALRVLRWVGRS